VSEIGFLRHGDGAATDLVLRPGDPLSKLRLADGSSIAKALVQAGSSPFWRRIPLAVARDSLGEASDLLGTRGGPSTFPVTLAQDERAVAWVDLEQLERLQRETGRPMTLGPVVEVGGILLEPCVTLGAGEPVPVDGQLQYWNSRWVPAEGRPAELWRVWPQGSGEARGDFVARVSPEGAERLGTHVVVSPPNGRASLWAVLLADEEMTPSEPHTHLLPTEPLTVALDSSLRDALGISGGDFCRLGPWRRGSRVRRSQQRFFGARSVIAHVKIPPRSDLDKRVCRLEPTALEAIGATAGQSVAVESVVPDGADARFRVRTIRLRALPIDSGEATERKAWELPTGSEGFVDCAEHHGIFPPYPAIYLDYHARRALAPPELAGSNKALPVCSAVLVRTSVRRRVGDELSGYLWLAFAGLSVAAIKAFDLPVYLVLTVAAAVTALLLLLHIRRTLR
jgi:hypothetical protein